MKTKKKGKTLTLVIGGIEKLKKGRVAHLRSAKNLRFYVLSSYDNARRLKVGDTIMYEPHGTKFGVLVKE